MVAIVGCLRYHLQYEQIGWLGAAISEGEANEGGKTWNFSTDFNRDQ